MGMRPPIVFLVLAMFVGETTATQIPLAYGQIETVDSNNAVATVTCDTGFSGRGSVSSVSYTSSDGGATWTSTGLTTADLLCNPSNGVCNPLTSSSSLTGGDCSAYSLTQGVNYNYCTEDYVSVTWKGATYRQYAYQRCTECGKCSVTPTPTPTKVPLPAQLSRQASTVRGFGFKTTYADSPTSCSVEGISEVNPAPLVIPGYSMLGSTGIAWDFCAKDGELSCRDLQVQWSDSAGRNCRYYGLYECLSRARRLSSETLSTNGTFADYAAAASVTSVYGAVDATDNCCMCGGGTKKCFVQTLPESNKSPYIYDYSGCTGLIVGEQCTVYCYLDRTISSTVPCSRTTTLAGLTAESFPTCPSTVYAWGIMVDNDVTGKDKTCTGSTWGSVITPTTGYQDCIKEAEVNCQGNVVWDSAANTCQIFTPTGCEGYTLQTNSHILARPNGTRPSFPPVVSSCQEVDGLVTLQYSITDCLDPAMNPGNFGQTVSFVLLIKATAVADGTVVDLGDVILPYPVPGTVSVSASSLTLGSTYSFTLQSAASDLSVLSPVSEGCQVTVT